MVIEHWSFKVTNSFTGGSGPAEVYYFAVSRGSNTWNISSVSRNSAYPIVPENAAGNILAVNSASGAPGWKSASDVKTILGLSTVATSGSYNDLSDKPSALPSYASGDAGKVLSVNSSGTGVEWATAASGGGGASGPKMLLLSHLLDSGDTSGDRSFLQGLCNAYSSGAGTVMTFDPTSFVIVYNTDSIFYPTTVVGKFSGMGDWVVDKIYSIGFLNYNSNLGFHSLTIQRANNGNFNASDPTPIS